MKDKIVCIDWIDSCTDTRWMSREEAGEHRASNCHSTGYLLRKTAREVIIFQSKSDWSGQVSDLMAIPTKAIIKITELKES